MKVITVANQKGGVGKTTIAANLAVQYALNGKKTILLDSDSQSSSMAFKAMRPDNYPEISAVSITKPTIHRDIKTLKADYVIIDAGGRESDVYRSAVTAADLLLVPLGASPFDVLASEATFKLFKEISTSKDIKGCVLLNMLPPLGNQKVVAEVLEFLEEITKKYKLQILKTSLFSRVAYKEIGLKGMGVCEFEGEKYEKAAAEIKALYNEINKILGE